MTCAAHLSLNLPARLLAVAAGLVACADVQALDERIELKELQTTLDVAYAKIQALEKETVALTEQKEALSQSAAAANAQVSQLRENYERLRGLLEGLGIGALENSTSEVQDRLVASLNDLRLVDARRQKATEALIALAEASMAFAKTVPNPDNDAANQLVKALGEADSVIQNANGGQTIPGAGDLHNARVVSLKQELGILVLGVGSKDGVKPGMPFEIYRADKPIARALVTDVRQSVSGAVVQTLVSDSDPVQVGDRGQVDPNKTF